MYTATLACPWWCAESSDRLSCFRAARVWPEAPWTACLRADLCAMWSFGLFRSISWGYGLVCGWALSWHGWMAGLLSWYYFAFLLYHSACLYALNKYQMIIIGRRVIVLPAKRWLPSTHLLFICSTIFSSILHLSWKYFFVLLSWKWFLKSAVFLHQPPLSLLSITVTSFTAFQHLFIDTFFPSFFCTRTLPFVVNRRARREENTFLLVPFC